MGHCAACGAKVAERDRFCGRCGAPAGAPSTATTTTSLPRTPDTESVALGTGAPTRPLRSPSTPSGIQDGRFPPGAMLAGRWRIVGLLGRGGMGEVYRADDFATIVAVFVTNLVLNSPITLEGSAWFARQGWAMLLVPAALAAYGCYLTMADRKWNRDPLAG